MEGTGIACVAQTTFAGPIYVSVFCGLPEGCDLSLPASSSAAATPQEISSTGSGSDDGSDGETAAALSSSATVIVIDDGGANTNAATSMGSTVSVMTIIITAGVFIITL